MKSKNGNELLRKFGVVAPLSAAGLAALFVMLVTGITLNGENDAVQDGATQSFVGAVAPVMAAGDGLVEQGSSSAAMTEAASESEGESLSASDSESTSMEVLIRDPEVDRAAELRRIDEERKAALSTSQRDLAKRVEDCLQDHLTEMTSDKAGSDFWKAPWRDLLLEHEMAFIEAVITALQVDRDYALGVIRDYHASAQNGGNTNGESNAAAPPTSATTSTPDSTNDGVVIRNQGGEQ